MSRKKRKLKKEQEQRMQQQAAMPKIVYKPMHNGLPMAVAPASDFVQLTPIIQPIAMVPYSTQQQPLLTMLDDELDI